MKQSSMSKVALVAMLTVALTPVGALGASNDAAPSPESSWAPTDDAARIVMAESLDARTRDLTIESPTVGTAKVRLLLPPEYDTRTDETFPVLYLLHGGGGGYADWTKNTDVETYTAATDVIVAMPDALSSRLDTWLSEGGPPNWEHFHVNELPELLERYWRAGENRAVGGLSLGGYTAMMYAGHDPDLYQAVGSYSGALGLALLQDAPEEATELVEQATALAEAAGWDDAEPVELLPSMAETATYISYGNGEPGPLDPAGTDDDLLEAWIGLGNDDSLVALAEEAIPAEVNAYGPGTHSWSYWDRELKASLPLLMDALGHRAGSADGEE